MPPRPPITSGGVDGLAANAGPAPSPWDGAVSMPKLKMDKAVFVDLHSVATLLV